MRIPYVWSLVVIVCFLTSPALAQEKPEEEKSTSLNEVIVESVMLRNNWSPNINNLSKKDIQLTQSGNDVPFVLARFPSVVAYSDGGTGMGYTGLRLRGTDLTGINVTINGVPYNDAESHGVFFVNVPSLMSASKEVTLQRGVGVSAQGTSAFGGALAFNTLPDFSNEWNASGSIGSFFSRTLSVRKSFSPSEKFALNVAASYSGTDGYRERSWVNLGSLSLSATYKASPVYETSLAIFLGKEKLYLAWDAIDAEQLKTNRRYNPLGYKADGSIYPNETDNYAQAHVQWINSFRFSPRLSLHATTYYTKGGGYYEEYKDAQNLSEGDYSIAGLTSQTEAIIRRLYLDNDLLGQQLLLSLVANPHHQFSLGLSGNNYWGRHFGDVVSAEKSPIADYRYYSLDANKYDIQSFVRWQWNTTSKNIFGYVDMQWRNVNYQINGFPDYKSIQHHVDYHFFNPKMGVGASLKNQRLLFSFAVGQREPIREDFKIGNKQNLPSPERVFDWELEHQWQWRFIQTTTTFYLMYYKNQLVNNGRINDVGGYTRENVNTSYRLGLEFSYKLHLLNNLDLSGNFNLSKNAIEQYTLYIDNVDTKQQEVKTFAETPISFSPSIVNSVYLGYAPWTVLRLSLVHQYVGKQYLDLTGNDNLSLSGYQTLGFQVDYTLQTAKSGQVLVQFFINNLTNQLYTHNGFGYSTIEGSTQKDYAYYYPAAGININFSVKWTLARQRKPATQTKP